MSSILALPNELLLCILSYLEQPDRKHFRLVSLACEQLTASLIFQEVSFDLGSDGCKKLASIAASSRLRPHVCTLRLKIQASLVDFDDFEQWNDCVIYEYTLNEPNHNASQVPVYSNTMTSNEWISLSQAQRQELYNDYVKDRIVAENHLLELRSAISSSLSQPHFNEPKSKGRTSDAQSDLQSFIVAINALVGVQHFIHTPATQTAEFWIRPWRNLEFHHDSLGFFGRYGDYFAMDEIQLLAALYYILQAPSRITHVELYSSGRAFWSASYMDRLLQWDLPHVSDDDTDEAPQHQDDSLHDAAIFIDRVQAITRAFVKFERSFSRLTSFTCRLDPLWDPSYLAGPRDTPKILSNAIQEASRLEELSLVLRDGAESDYEPASRRIGMANFFEDDENMLCSLAISEHVMGQAAIHSPFRLLKRLHISLATSVSCLLPFMQIPHNLRHLRLDHVSLILDGGNWETVFTWVASHLELDSIELQALSDTYETEPRLLFWPHAPVWTTEDSKPGCYQEFKDTVVSYALRRSKYLPPLLPEQ